MKEQSLFDRLFIFELANNHMGDVEHGIKVIQHIHEVSKDYPFRFAFKFQYRNLDAFIHPDFQDRMDLKYIKRFIETKISEEQFLRLRDEVKRLGFTAICTPFDEDSVDRVVKHDYDVIKVASCAFTDWPLLEKIAETDKPIILSTAAASLEEIDRVVSFLEHRNKKFALMHCVGEYPTQLANMQLGQLSFLKKRFPDLTVGYSTHEDPDNTDAIKMAIAKGARLFEKHVGLATEAYGINGYSASPEQVKRWLDAAVLAYEMCGVEDERYKPSDKEKEDLRGLKRGVFVKHAVSVGQALRQEDLFLAIPNEKGQVLANDCSKYSEFITQEDLQPQQAVRKEQVSEVKLREKMMAITLDVKKLLHEARITLPEKSEVEISHHYGIDKFEECGATIINCINREYCKKLIILLPGQSHPVHFHKRKEETFHVLYGQVTVQLGNKVTQHKAGELIIIERNMPHSFSSETGCIFEEISTTHYDGDSYYRDKSISENKNRKTKVTFYANWYDKSAV